jgi:SH3 domain-containing YSC84-like protein 1
MPNRVSLARATKLLNEVIGMISRAGFLRGTTALAAGALCSSIAPMAALAQTDQQVTVDAARKVLGDLRKDKEFGNAKQLLRRARAVLIVPHLLKGGFFVGGEGGQGVLMVRQSSGWSQPGFYAVGAASFGLQIGLEQAELIMLIMTEKGLNGVLRNEFKIGAQAGISVATLGSGVEGAIGGPTPPDIVVWSSATGVYGGLTVDGTIIRAEPNQDSAFYGRKLTIREALYGKFESSKTVDLRRELHDLT